MKSIRSKFTLLSIASVLFFFQAHNASGQSQIWSFGPGNWFGTQAYGSISVGGTNSNNSTYSLAAGSNNNISQYFSSAIGRDNVINASASFTIGASNQISVGYCSCTFGYGNFIYSNYSISAGNSNLIGVNGDSTASIGQNSIAIGNGLVCTNYNAIIVGMYNKNTPNSTTLISTDPLFVVGNGTSAGARADAMTILKDGTVLINPKGDLSMGTYVNGPQP